MNEWIVNIAGGIILALGIGGVAMFYKIKYVARKTGEISVTVNTLLEMHKHPDDFGFGTKSTNKLLASAVKTLEATTKALIELVTELRISRELREKK